MYRLSDIFIGDHPPTEFFGANPAIYNARYSIQGYPGIRVKMSSLTPILAAAEGYVHEVGFEEAGKGKFVVLVHDGFLTVYGHLNDILVQKDEKVIQGQLIAHSNQSGLAEYPCLYFGIAPCDAAGTKTLDNGYGGFIDPLGSEIDWDIKNPKEPVTHADNTDKMTLTSKDYAILNAQATNYKVIIAYLKQKTEFESFLVEQGRTPVSPEMTPDDPKGGEAVTFYLDMVADEFDALTAEVEKATGETPEEIEVIVKKDTHLVRFFRAVKKFVFTS